MKEELSTSSISDIYSSENEFESYKTNTKDKSNEKIKIGKYKKE